MGLHAGRAAVGEVGYLETTTFTAIGEVVNTASRLQDHSKTAASRLVVSLFAAQQAGAAEAIGDWCARVRGRTEPLAVLYAVRSGRPHPDRSLCSSPTKAVRKRTARTTMRFHTASRGNDECPPPTQTSEGTLIMNTKQLIALSAAALRMPAQPRPRPCRPKPGWARRSPPPAAR